WYVLAKDTKRNVLLVGQGHDHPALFSQQLTCEQVHWISNAPPTLPFSCTAKIRYRQTQQACIIQSYIDNRYRVEFKQPQRAITPGQSVVFYQHQQCLGGGVITASSQPENP